MSAKQAMLATFCCAALAWVQLAADAYAEEVLSSRPLVISPKRIETKTVIPEKPISAQPSKPVKAVKAAKKPEKAATKIAASAIRIRAEKVIAQITFNPGSIRLTDEAQKQLRSLDLKPGDKIRIYGFGDPAGRKMGGKRIANFRARVAASFLEEVKKGNMEVELQWDADPNQAFPDKGCIIERAD